MKKTTEHFFCDLCGKEDLVYRKYQCKSYTSGNKPVEAVGLNLIITPFGPGIIDVCIECLQKALDEMTKKRIVL